MQLRQAIIFGVVMMGLAGAAFAEPLSVVPGDAEARQKIIGSWTYAGTSATNVMRVNYEKYIFGGKGDLKKEILLPKEGRAVKVFSDGTWEIKDGVVITTITSKTMPNGEVEQIAKPFISHMKLINLTDHELVVRTERGNSLMTLKR